MTVVTFVEQPAFSFRATRERDIGQTSRLIRTSLFEAKRALSLFIGRRCDRR